MLSTVIAEWRLVDLFLIYLFNNHLVDAYCMPNIATGKADVLMGVIQTFLST